MNNRLRLVLIAGGALLVAVVFTFPLWRPLFVDTVVNEAFPGLSPEQQTAFQQLAPEQQEMFQEMMKTSVPMAQELAKAALSPDVVVPTAEQAMPQMTNPVVVATGSFTEIDLVHKASGTATIYQLPDNSRVLRFEDFKATNGPDLHVLLTRNPDPRSPADVGNDYIDLGSLKGNVGNQNYAVPGEVDLTTYRGLVIYCVPFGVVFSTAKLTVS